MSIKFEVDIWKEGKIIKANVDLFAHTSKPLLDLVIKQAEKDHSAENINFLIAVNKLSDEPSLGAIKEIYNKFIKPGVPDEINTEDNLKLVKPLEDALASENIDEARRCLNNIVAEIKKGIKNNEVKRANKELPDEFVAAVAEVEKQEIFDLTYSLYLKEPIIPKNLRVTNLGLYEQMESVLLAPIERAYKISDPQQRHIEIGNARTQADKIIALAMAADKANNEAYNEDTIAKSFAAREKYLSELSSFVEQEKANLYTLRLPTDEIEQFELKVNEMRSQLRNEQEAAKRLKAETTKQAEAAKPAPEKETAPPKNKSSLREKLSNLSPFKKKQETAQMQTMAQKPKEPKVDKALESKKTEAKKLIKSIQKQTVGLDKNKANEWYRPLALAITQLNSEINSPNATKRNIEDKMKAVKIQQQIYQQTLDEYFSFQKKSEEGRFKAAVSEVDARVKQHQKAAEEIAKEGKVSLPKIHEVRPMSEIEDRHQNLVPADAEQGFIYVSKTGHYFSYDDEGVIRQGILKGLSGDELQDKEKVNQAYAIAELESDKNKAADRLVAAAHQEAAPGPQGHPPLVPAFQYKVDLEHARKELEHARKELAQKKAKEARDLPPLSIPNKPKP